MRGFTVLLILLVIFITVPIIEIVLFTQVSDIFGWWLTVTFILLTTFVGASIVHSQGILTLLLVQQRLLQGELPAEQIIKGILLAGAGVLLLMPGFMTDSMGMILLLPWSRVWLTNQIIRRVKIAGLQNNFNSDPFKKDDRGKSNGNDTFEGEYERKNDVQDRLN
ncbi:FxsA family protein [Candidatus Enterovibrio altilux]|uniref:FxsA family protein n=1 Tax=Candidatus Enterovibrio altilux TaxID=1927128 RepID=UPI000BBBAAA9|nr:FxsA family protein [Candidatus Enterovibrio luxaltus]